METLIHLDSLCSEQRCPAAYLCALMLLHCPVRAAAGNAKIAKDAKETVQECLSEFISFITSE